MAGVFISLEGIEGAGKSTQARLLADTLNAEGIRAVHTVEPGGTEIGREIRGILLNPNHQEMSPVTELLLYAAARRQHMDELILPALERGEIVITDRFSDSTMAYQGYARGLDTSLISKIDQIATGGVKPGLTVLLDMNPERGIARNQQAGKHDRFEIESMGFHMKVREGFLLIMGAEPGRVRLIDASRGIDEVSADIAALVREFIAAKA